MVMRPRRETDHLGTLTIGDLAIALHGSDPRLARIVEGRYRPFLTDAVGDLSLALRAAEPTAGTAAPYDPVTTLDDGVLESTSDVARVRVDLETRTGTIAIAPVAGAAQYYLENALRQVVQVIALERDALLVHAAAVAPTAGDRVQLFAGRSGAGKSTISGLLRDAGGHVLSDDLVLLETRADRPRIGSTPFHGTLPPGDPRPVALPLTAAFLLEQAATAEVSEPLPRARALAGLMTNIPFLAPLDAAAHRRAIEVIDRVLAVVPVRTLRFAKDLSMLPLLGWTPVRGRTVEDEMTDEEVLG